MLVRSHLFETVLSILVARYLEVELLDHMVILNFWETAVLFYTAAAAAAKSLQLCLTLCDLIDGSPSGSPISVILQRTLKNTEVGYHFLLRCMKVKSEREVTQSCLTLHDPMDCSLPGSSVYGIFQARVLE